MSLAPQLTSWLLQAAVLPDTLPVKVIRGETTWYDITSGTLQLIVLVLAVLVLAALAWVLISVKKGLDAVKGTVEKLSADARPLIAQANEIAVDAREVVAMLRTDVERVTHAAGELSEQLLDVAAVTERRMDDINAVIDVVQGELEETVLSTAASLRGLRLGGRAIAGALAPRRKKTSRALREAGSDRARDRDRLDRDATEHERERLSRREARRHRDEEERRHRDNG